MRYCVLPVQDEMAQKSDIGTRLVDLLADQSWQSNIPESDRVVWFNAIANAIVDLWHKGIDAKFVSVLALSALRVVNNEYGRHQSI